MLKASSKAPTSLLDKGFKSPVREKVAASTIMYICRAFKKPARLTDELTQLVQNTCEVIKDAKKTMYKSER